MKKFNDTLGVSTLDGKLADSSSIQQDSFDSLTKTGDNAGITQKEINAYLLEKINSLSGDGDFSADEIKQLQTLAAQLSVGKHIVFTDGTETSN